MANNKHYPSKRNYPNNSLVNPIVNSNRSRYKKGHQNSLMSGSRRTETYYKDKTVVVTESVYIIEFNNDNFDYNHNGNNNKYKSKLSKNNYNGRYY